MLDEYQKQIVELVKQSGTFNPVEYVDKAVKELAMDTMNEYIAECSYCDICSKRKTMVTGNPYGSILAICDFPQDNPEMDSKPYVEKLLKKAGINPRQIIWTSAVYCYPGGEKRASIPKKTEISNCQVFLDYAIDTFKPLFILAVGNIALSGICKEGNMAKMHGEWFMVRDNIPSMGVFSMTAIKRIVDKETAEVWENDLSDDLLKFSERIRSEFPDSDFLIK